MKTLVAEFLNYLSVERGLARNTLMAYERDLTAYTAHLQAAGVSSPDAVTHRHIGAYMMAQKKNGLAPVHYS